MVETGNHHFFMDGLSALGFIFSSPGTVSTVILAMALILLTEVEEDLQRLGWVDHGNDPDADLGWGFFVVFSPTATSVAQGSLAQITVPSVRSGAASTPGSGEGSGTEVRWGSAGFRCRYLGEVSEGSGADAEVRFRKVLVQRLGQVPEGQVPGQDPEGSGTQLRWSSEGSSADRRWSSGRFLCRCWGQILEGSGAEVRSGSGADNQVRIRKVPVQRLGEVPEGSGADT